VIGVMEKQGGSFMGGPDFDRQVLHPDHDLREGVRRAVRPDGPEHRGQGADPESVPDLEYMIKGEMRKLRSCARAPDNFSINKLDTLLGTFSNVMGIVLLVGLLVTGHLAVRRRGRAS
jgi:hypothetical protein